ncbi:MAG: T9SS type A sorting domain-containing protein, partial [Bacteroidia bacterium]
MKIVLKNIFFLALVIFLIKISVKATPTIVFQPVNKTACAGSNTYFSIIDSSSCTINHQWQILNGGVWLNITNSGIYSGATSDTLWLTSVTTPFNGYYFRCNITTSTCGLITSDSVKLTVNTIPVITTQPVDAVYSGDFTMMNIAASGGNIIYQWQCNNTNLSTSGPWSYFSNQGINSDTLFIHYDTWFCAPWCGEYSGLYQCTVSNGCGTDTSQTVYSYFGFRKWNGGTSSSWNVASNWENKSLICFNWGTTSFHYVLSSTSSVPGNGSRIYISPDATHSPIVVGKVSIDYVIIPNGQTLSLNSNSDTIILGAIDNYIVMNGIYDGSKGTTYTVTPSNWAYPWNSLPSGNYYRIYFSNSGQGASFYGGSNTIIKNNITSLCSIFLYNSDLIIDTDATYSLTSIYSTGTAYTGIPFTGRFVVRNVGGTNRTGPVLFPMSTSCSYGVAALNAPLTITNTGTPDEFRVRVIDSVTNSYSSNIPVGSKLNNNVVGKTWFIEEGTPGGSNVTLTFSWDSVSEKTGFTRNNSYFSKYSSSGWIPGTTSSSTLSSGLFTKTVTGLSSFGIFGIGSNGALPVELVSFEGKISNGNALLNWRTSSEINNSGFIVLRSADNLNFEIAGKVEGNNNSNTINQYRFEDKDAANYFKQNRTLYYRLKQVDLDGLSSTSSKTITLKPPGNSGTEIFFEPNPFTESTNFRIKTLESNGTIRISITDIAGRKLIEKEFTISTYENLISMGELGRLNVGLYFVHVDIDGQIQNIKLVKQRIKLLITLYGKKQMPNNNCDALVVSRGVTSQLENLCTKIL